MQVSVNPSEKIDTSALLQIILHWTLQAPPLKEILDLNLKYKKKKYRRKKGEKINQQTNSGCTSPNTESEKRANGNNMKNQNNMSPSQNTNPTMMAPNENDLGEQPN